MIVAVNTRTLPGTRPEGYSYFIMETFRRIMRDHPGDQFIFITDPSLKKDLITGPNSKVVVSGPQNKHPLLWKLWYDVKLPAMLRRYKADLCIALGGHCSTTSKTAQSLLVYDAELMVQLHKKQLGRSLQKAGSVTVLSAFSKASLVDNFDTGAKKIEMIPAAPHAISQPLDHAERSSVKEQYTDGKEFFFYTTSIDPFKNWMTVLKAFSVFKKRQQSGMKLVMAVEPGRNYRSFTNDLNSYKYREDVVLTSTLSEKEKARLMGAAYALIYPSGPEGLMMPVLDAMRSEVAVITAFEPLEGEITKGAVLNAAADHVSIGDAMMRLYKDETLRNELIKKGSAAIVDHSWDRTAKLLWAAALKAIG
jgi:glycosyltransferase involved in cell wall biosynthesis